jgi:hypothetical protein
MRAYKPPVVQPPWRSRSSRPLRVSLTDSISFSDPWARVQPGQPGQQVPAVNQANGTPASRA